MSLQAFVSEFLTFIEKREERLLSRGQQFTAQNYDTPPEDDDERRRYYRITAEGTAAARAEARRLGQLVKMARAVGLAPSKA
jgi:hypothetical protein